MTAGDLKRPSLSSHILLVVLIEKSKTSRSLLDLQVCVMDVKFFHVRLILGLTLFLTSSICLPNAAMHTVASAATRMWSATVSPNGQNRDNLLPRAPVPGLELFGLDDLASSST